MLNITLFYSLFFFFFNDTATTEIYTLSLHDALPISTSHERPGLLPRRPGSPAHLSLRRRPPGEIDGDRKSTRLNSSHSQISYAVFCLKKKKIKYKTCTESVQILLLRAVAVHYCT